MAETKPKVRAEIIGSGSGPGKLIVTNAEVMQLMREAGHNGMIGDEQLTEAWFREKLGIEVRRYADPTEENPTTEMAIRAAREAMEVAEVTANEIDYMMVGTTTPDRLTPATVFAVMDALGINNALPNDLANACNSFATSLFYTTAALNLYGGKALVIGAETLSRKIDYTDPNVSGIFSDYAAAVVVEQTPDTDPDSGMVTAVWGSNPSSRDQLTLEHTVVVDDKVIEGKIYMNGPRVGVTILKLVPDLIPAALLKAGWRNPEAEEGTEAGEGPEADHGIIHQASGPIIERLLDRIPIDVDKVPVYFDHTGNASAATVGLTYDKLRKSGAINTGDRILFISVGIGASALVIAWRQ